MCENELDPLEQLLAAVEETESVDKQSKQVLNSNDDEFFKAISSTDKSLNSKKSKGHQSTSKQNKKSNLSLVHTGDTDSSDEESNRDFQNSKYNEFGKQIKHLLPEEKSKSEFYGAGSSTWKQKRGAPTKTSFPSLQSALFQPKQEENVLNDPFFGIRISKPLISSAVLQEKMSGRAAIPMARVKTFVATITPNQDWVIAGAVVQKSNVRTSQKGSQYIIWTLSDLQNDLQTVSLFLFRSAYKELWKTAIGTVIGVLNPAILENRDGNKHQATLSVDNHQKVMVFGQSKDYGLCKSKRKDGEQCTSFVNINRCSFCIYHVKQEYQKCSLRSELQSKFAGGGLTALRNKVLGKNEVFYAGKSYTAIPATKSKKMAEKDNKRLLALNQQGIATTAPVIQKKKGVAASLDVSRAQRIKDMQLLQKLNGTKDICFGLDTKSNFDKEQVSQTVTIEESKKFALEFLANFQTKKTDNSETTKFDKTKISETVTIEESKKNAVETMNKLKDKMTAYKTKSKVNKTQNSELKLTELNKEQFPTASTSKINFVPNLSNPEGENVINFEEKNKVESSTSKLTELNKEQNTSKINFIPKLSNPEDETGKNDKISNTSNSKIKLSNPEKDIIQFEAGDKKDINKEQISKASTSKTDFMSKINYLEKENELGNDSKNKDLDPKPSTSIINTEQSNSTKVLKLSNPEQNNKISNREKEITPKKEKQIKKTKNADLECKESQKLNINKEQNSEASTSKTDFMSKINSEKENEEFGNSSKNKDLDSKPSTSKINTEQLNNKKVLNLSNSEQNNKISNREKEVTPTQLKNESFKSCINIPNVDIESIVDVSKLKMFKDLTSQPAPKLSHNGDFKIDLNSPIPKRRNRAKLTALQWVQKNGPIKKENPTGTKKAGVKRFLESVEDPEAKKSKLDEKAEVSQRFRKILEMTSKHKDLLEDRDLEEQEKYFNRLETREKLEEKMLTTYKIQCKAVKCLTCKYTSFSAADRCKEEKHPLKVFDAMKRFFKCGNCGNRTVALDICPLFSCKQCGGTKWERTTMMKEKTAHVGEALSIRGGEQTFISSVVSNANINLLVPDD